MIKNFDELATTENRKIALEIMNSGLDSINTEKVIQSSVSLKENILIIQGESFDLAKFEKIKVVGFGKASPLAGLALEKILGDKINEGAIVGLNKVLSKFIETFAGTHPVPSAENIEAGQKIHEIVSNSGEKDLIIALVSGGGSALLCYSSEECAEGIKFYNAFLKCGKTIEELNTVRKHLSILKGGGLAKLSYPATVIGLIFSDIPGNHFEDVSSGPTYQDRSTVADAEKIIDEGNLGKFDLMETPKEDKYFEKVHNFVLVSNEIAVEAMQRKAQEFGLEANIISTELYDEVGEAVEKIFSAGEETSQARKGISQVLGKNPQTMGNSFSGLAVLAAGEPKLVVPKNSGKGGRNLHMGLMAIQNNFITKENSDSVFISFASDGMDNSDAAGAVVDKSTIEKSEKLGLNAKDNLERFDSYEFFQKTGDIIMTGPTGANVSDLMILLRKK